MLVISKRQMAAFDAHSFDQFVHRLTPFIRANCGAQSAWNPALVPDGDAQLSAAIRAHLMRARTYGMNSEASLAAFVSLAFSFSPEFDQLPVPIAVLRDQAIPPEDCIFNIFRMIVESEAVRAAAW